jgi:hypothetical protein
VEAGFAVAHRLARALYVSELQSLVPRPRRPEPQDLHPAGHPLILRRRTRQKRFEFLLTATAAGDMLLAAIWGRFPEQLDRK